MRAEAAEGGAEALRRPRLNRTPVVARLHRQARPSLPEIHSGNPACVAGAEPLRRRARAQRLRRCAFAIRLAVLSSIPAHEAWCIQSATASRTEDIKDFAFGFLMDAVPANSSKS